MFHDHYHSREYPRGIGRAVAVATLAVHPEAGYGEAHEGAFYLHGLPRRPRRGRVEESQTFNKYFSIGFANPAKGLQRITLPAHASAPPAFRRSLATLKSKKGCMERVLLIRLETVEPEAFEDTLKELRRTSTYGHRTQRTIEKTRAALKELQSGRKSAYEKAQQEAILLTQLAHLKGEPARPVQRIPVPRTLWWLCLFTRRSRSSHRSRRPPGGGQGPLHVCVGQASQSS